MRIPLLSLIMLILVVTVACSSTNDNDQILATDETVEVSSYRAITIDELADAMANTDRDYTVINVHIPYQGEIDGTDYNIAFDDLDALTEALPDRDAPIILYCRSGNMSEQATNDLIELGYTQVYDVPGGMNAWQADGHSLIDNQ